MNRCMKQTFVAVLAVGLLVSGVAQAARLGGGKSAGISRSYNAGATQRSAPTYTPSARPAPVAPAAPLQTQRTGPGVGSMVAAGAAGAAAGYMLGSATNEPAQATQQSGVPAEQRATANTQQPSQTKQGFSMTWLLLLGAAGFFAMSMLRRRNTSTAVSNLNTATPTHTTLDARPANAPISFPKSAINTPSVPNGRLPDGTEQEAFLRQAKASFLHMQTMNGAEHLDSLRAFMTPQMFESIREDIAQNNDVADFPVLELKFLGAEEEGMDYIASVQFSGQVSEASGQAAQPFSEIWHFTKPKGNSLSWKLAGIEQTR